MKPIYSAPYNDTAGILQTEVRYTQDLVAIQRCWLLPTVIALQKRNAACDMLNQGKLRL